MSVQNYVYKFVIPVNGTRKSGPHEQSVGARNLTSAIRCARDFARSASHDRNPGEAKLIWTDDPQEAHRFPATEGA